MEFYNVEDVNERIKVIRSACGELMYLIEGKEKAVLIDTCLGVGHLKNLVERLTNKPLTVLLSHGHVDHALGAPEFDTVYMNHADLAVYQRMSPLEERKGYIAGNLGPDIAKEIKDEDYVMPAPDKTFLDLKDHMKFELGGISIEVISFPGHTKGSMVFLIPEERILILGDACNNATFLFDQDAVSVTDYRSNVIEVQKRTQGKFDRVFQMHHDMETGNDIMTNMVEICDEVLEGKADDIPFHFMGHEAYIAKACNERFVREDGKSGNLVYSKEKL